MTSDEIKKTNKSNSTQLKYCEPLCNFTRLTYFLRWRREKGEGGEKLSLEFHHIVKVDTCQPTV
jgi:hypothetical protein